jgi:hypothetical protein
VRRWPHPAEKVGCGGRCARGSGIVLPPGVAALFSRVSMLR